jgi:hypothetical protein
MHTDKQTRELILKKPPFVFGGGDLEIEDFTYTAYVRRRK